MKNTTEDLWPESRPPANGIEPTDAQGESVPGICHSPSTAPTVKEVDAVRWLTGHLVARSTNPEIRE
jgi:hypothetical protein